METMLNYGVMEEWDKTLRNIAVKERKKLEEKAIEVVV